MPPDSACQKRLGAVYDAFDKHNYKAALKLCNAGIQKYPEAYAFQSLKAVALARSGKMDEAVALTEALLAAAPPDDHVLNMLLLVLKPANRVGDLAAAYEAAVRKQPGNEDLLHGLFACHARAFDFAGQQQVAMRLNKQHPSELYQWWVVTSLALQAHQAAVACTLAQRPAGDTASSSSNGQQQQPAAGGLSPDKLLQLAEAMAGRLLSKAPAQGGQQHSWEAVMLYLGLLQAQGKHDAALAALRGSLSASFSMAAERREAEATLLLAKGDLEAAAALHEAALREEPDDWAVLLLYLDCLLPSTASTLPACSSTAVAQMVAGVEATTRPGCQAGGLPALLAAMSLGEAALPPLPERVARAEAFIASLASQQPAAAQPGGANGTGSSSSSKAAMLRGPSLAAVELRKRKLQLALATERDVVAAVLAYHAKFGHVVSCAMDVFCYLGLLGDASRQQLAEQLAARAEAAAEQLQQQQQEQQVSDGSAQQQPSNKALLRLLRQQMSARQIQADLGSPAFTDAAAAEAHAQRLLQGYAAALPFYEGMDERERGPADELLWQAAAGLVQAAALQDGSSSSSDGTPGGVRHLLQALLVLEAAAKGRPYCAPVQLGLTGLHGLLGNAEAAAAHFGVMDVKHVQHDTLSSHHLAPLLLGLRAEGAAAKLLRASCALFEEHGKDAGDTLMQAFTNGTYTKVLEFVCFKERLERSHTFALSRAERALLSISTAATAAAAPASGASVSDALATALEALPVSHLDSVDWRGMRFNDDLTTRLPWLPPIQGPRHLVVLLWWEQQQAAAGSSSTGSGGAQWWRQVAAAEADVPQAAALRGVTMAAAQQRWLLPHLLHAALQVGSSSSAGADSGASCLASLLARYAAALGCSSVQELEAQLEACFGAGRSATGGAGAHPASRQLQLLDAALFSLAQSMQALLLPPAQAEAAAAVAAKAQLLSAALQALQQRLEAHLTPDAAYQGCLLPGHVLSLAALLLHEGCTWLLLCLESWSKAIRAGRKKRAKKPSSSGGDPLATHAQEASKPEAGALQALARLQDSAQALLAAVADGAERLLQHQQQRGGGDAVAAGLLAALGGGEAVDALVGWEPRLSAQAVLADAVGQQTGLLLRLRDGARGRAARLQALGW